MIAHGMSSIYAGLAFAGILIVSSLIRRRQGVDLGSLIVGVLAAIGTTSGVALGYEILMVPETFHLSTDQISVIILGCLSLSYISASECVKVFRKIARI